VLLVLAAASLSPCPRHLPLRARACRLLARAARASPTFLPPSKYSRLRPYPHPRARQHCARSASAAWHLAAGTSAPSPLASKLCEPRQHQQQQHAYTLRCQHSYVAPSTTAFRSHALGFVPLLPTYTFSSHLSLPSPPLPSPRYTPSLQDRDKRRDRVQERNVGPTLYATRVVRRSALRSTCARHTDGRGFPAIFWSVLRCPGA
jgi:hypothetical protein